jgi:hypothetical protein
MVLNGWNLETYSACSVGIHPSGLATPRWQAPPGNALAGGSASFGHNVLQGSHLGAIEEAEPPKHA